MNLAIDIVYRLQQRGYSLNENSGKYLYDVLSQSRPQGSNQEFINKTVNQLISRFYQVKSVSRKAYIVLDRRFVTDDCDNLTVFKWTISPVDKQGASVYTAPQVKNVTKIKVLPFYLPAFNSNYTLSNISLEIFELSAQSYYIPQLNKRFLFNFLSRFIDGTDSNIHPTYAIDGELITENPSGVAVHMILNQSMMNKNNEFEFNSPINHLDTLTLRFGDPYTALTFPRAVYKCVFQSGSPTNLESVDGVTAIPVSIGDQVWLSGFTITNPSGNDAAIVSAFNGYQTVSDVGGINFYIDFDSSMLQGSPSNVTVFIMKYNFNLRVELSYNDDS